jgi:hypothetical protein
LRHLRIVGFKLVPWDVLGIWSDGAMRRDINPPATQTIQATIGSIDVGVDWQVTERTLLYCTSIPGPRSGT